jgi:hypothetical protein
MKTCKTGCGKMKAGGTIKKVKKMAVGGQALNKAKGFAKPTTGGDNVSKQIYGVPNAGPTGPNRQGIDTMKKGGAVKKYQKGGQTIEEMERATRRDILGSKSSKIGVGTSVAGVLGVASKAIADKVKAKRAAKKTQEEKKKKETAKAKFGASVSVKHSCKAPLVRDASGKCVMVRKMAKGGFPDLTGDGKVTKADVLKGRGVIKRKGGSVKK